PGTLDPAQGKAAKRELKERYQYVLAGMVSMGNLDADEAAKYEKRLPEFPEIPEVSNYGGQRGYLLNLVEQKLQQLKFTDEEINGGGLKVVTTLSWQDSIAAAKAVTEERPEGRPQLHVALSAVDPRTGALRAMIGGRDYTGGGPKDQVNFALAPTQVGSTMKAYAVAAGLKDGFTLRDTFDGNSPYTYPNGETVRNEGQSSGNPTGNSYGAAIPLTYATQESVNTAFADLTSRMKNGPQKVVDAAVAAGVPKESPDLEPNLGVALGSATIPNVEMAEGYSTFADNGVHHDWYVIEKVTDANGLRYEHKIQGDRAFTPAISSNVTYALEQVVKDGTGAAAQALERPAAGKTGTATFGTADNQYVSSSWFVGFTPQLSTAITYTRGDGNDSLEGYLEPFFGANYPTQTWTSFMEKALAGSPELDFPEPAELHGENPTYSPPPTTSEPPTTTSEPPTTTSEPPTTTSEPPTTTSEPPTTTSEPPTTPSEPTDTCPILGCPTTSTTTTTTDEEDPDPPGAGPDG
ncbi:MAG TPA: transglycosylase domain-containing protein, partial [Nocardioidaceae bacterium]